MNKKKLKEIIWDGGISIAIFGAVTFIGLWLILQLQAFFPPGAYTGSCPPIQCCGTCPWLGLQEAWANLPLVIAVCGGAAAVVILVAIWNGREYWLRI